MKAAWTKNEDGSWDLCLDGVEGHERDVEIPAIAYMQHKLDAETWDVFVTSTGSEEKMNDWKVGIVSRAASDKTIKAVYGEPRVVSSAKWEEGTLNLACASNGALWRLLRKEGLL